MRVRREFSDRQGVRLLAAALAQGVPAAYVDRGARAQIGEREVDPPIAAKGRAQQREERLVLVDRQQLAVAQSPSPCGANTKLMIRISLRKGSAINVSFWQMKSGGH